MDALNGMVDLAVWNGPIDASHIALGAALGYCERRHRTWPWRAGRSALSAWYDRIAATPSFQATIPPVA
jgi:PPE-repeat protein